jgi:hypothetical protein
MFLRNKEKGLFEGIPDDRRHLFSTLIHFAA